MNRVYINRKSMLVSEEGENSAVKCRERRRRRMAMRRTTVNKKSPAKTAPAADNPTSSTMNLISNMETTPPPVYGTTSVIGRRREMVDEVSVQTNLCRPKINGFQPVHFFGVFDGHVSAFCKEQMHIVIKEELMRVKVVGDESNGDGERWRLAFNRSFHRIDGALKLCGSNMCRRNSQLSLKGSRAVVSILTEEHVLVAKCGDSGAVICRDGRPVDHKGDRGGCGGRIMSRPIDERGFWATSEPEISITKREPRDECLILGSNGLWDVVSSETACKTVHECLGSSSELAATLLARVALGRRSADNISVIVVDLRK